MPEHQLILLFVKAPIRGQVKSRLAAVLGQDAALELYRNFVLDILSSIETSGIPFRICYHPPDSGETVRNWLGGHLQYMLQEGDNIGERMERAFLRAFSEGATRAVLIGSDIPDLPPALLQDAVGRLDRTGAVIGPAEDGGYYLIGFRSDAFLPEIFQGPEWSSDTVFRTTLQIFARAHQQVSLLTPWRDVDTVEDLHDLMNRNRSGRFISSRTMNYLSSLKGSMKSTEVSDAAV
ncbi:MAG: TIGR04282 family arsenosugar biosynthesis glycosyltransferase [Nitrospirota bacterium]